MAALRVAGRPRTVVMATSAAVLAALVAVGLAGCSAEPAESAGPATSSSTTPASSSLSPSTTAAAAATPTPTPTSSTSTRSTMPAAMPPFVARVQWVRGSGGRSLQIFPTASGRVAQGAPDDDEAWAEVLRLAPDADQPGMRAQFDCHWTFARLADPSKRSWNIEPWRPVVTDAQMVDARCNPGGPESAES